MGEGRSWTPPSTYIKRGRGATFYSIKNWDFSQLINRSNHLSPPISLSLSISPARPQFWVVLEGDFSLLRRAVVPGKLWSGRSISATSAGSEARDRRHTPYMCKYREALCFWRCPFVVALEGRHRLVKFFTTLRSASSSSSATPVRGCDHRVTVYKGMSLDPHVIVTALLIDRSWLSFGRSLVIIFLKFCYETPSVTFPLNLNLPHTKSNLTVEVIRMMWINVVSLF